MAVSDFLKSILLCPLSRKPVILDEETNTFVSTDPETRRQYRIEDDIPIMLVDESEELDEATWKTIMERTGAEIAR